MRARIARTAAVVAALLAVDYLVLVGLGLLLTRVLEGSSLLHQEDDLVTVLAHSRTPELDDVTYVLSGLGNTGAIVGALAVVATVLWLVRRRGVQVPATAALLAVPLLVAYGRLYRGMHHPTDVLGADVNGAACVAIAAGTILGRGRGHG